MRVFIHYEIFILSNSYCRRGRARHHTHLFVSSSPPPSSSSSGSPLPSSLYLPMLYSPTSFGIEKSFSKVSHDNPHHGPSITEPNPNKTLFDEYGSSDNSNPKGGNQLESNHIKASHEERLRVPGAFGIVRNDLKPIIEKNLDYISQGAKLLEEGEELVKKGKSMIHTAFKDITKHL